MTATHLFDAISIGDRVRLTADGGYAIEGWFTHYYRTSADVWAVVDDGDATKAMPMREIVRAERLRERSVI